jgi:hypothetical protein
MIVQIYVVRIRAYGASLPIYFDRSPTQSEVVEAVRELLHPSLHAEVLEKVYAQRYAIQQEVLVKLGS